MAEFSPPVDTKKTVFKIMDVGATLRTLTCALNGVTLNMEAPEQEFETFCAVEKVAGNVSASVDFSGRYDGGENEIDSVMHALLGGDATEFQYFPASVDTGNIKYHGSGVVTSYNVTSDVPGIVQVSGSVAVIGKPSRTAT